MRIFHSLEIIDEHVSLIQLLQTISKSLPEGWNLRDDYKESYIKNTSKSDDEVFCIQSPIIEEIDGLVWIGYWDKKIKIINIVPTKPGSLTYQQYNKILERFYEECIKPHINKQNVVYSNEDVNIESIAGNLTFLKMELWEENCNRYSGNINPYDFDRWTDFVITAYKEKSKLTSVWLERWLVEERGWKDDETTSRLVMEFEYSLELLERYDKY